MGSGVILSEERTDKIKKYIGKRMKERGEKWMEGEKKQGRKSER